jgi:hypothetical protein
MFAIPGFDPKTLSNDALFEKQLDLIRRSLQATRFGQGDTAQQFQMMIQAIEIERQERMFVDRIGNHMRAGASIVIESDPVLRDRDLAIEELDQPKPEKVARSLRRPVRSDKPVKPMDTIT